MIHHIRTESQQWQELGQHPQSIGASGGEDEERDLDGALSDQGEAERRWVQQMRAWKGKWQKSREI